MDLIYWLALYNLYTGFTVQKYNRSQHGSKKADTQKKLA